MTIKPLFNYVVMEPIKEDEKTEQGLYVPDSMTKPTRAKIIAVGPGRINDKGETVPMSVNPGDVVAYRDSRFETYKIDGKEMKVGKEDDLYFTT